MRIHSDSGISALLDRFEKIPVLERTVAQVMQELKDEEFDVPYIVDMTVENFVQRGQIYLRSLYDSESKIICEDCSGEFSNAQLILVSPLLDAQYVIPSVAMHYMQTHDMDVDVPGSNFSFEGCEEFVIEHYRAYGRLPISFER